MTTSDLDSNTSVNLEAVVANAEKVLSSTKLLRDARAICLFIRSFIDMLQRISPKVDPCETPEIVVWS